ncbi:MAG TPA: hypothetical protein VNS58_03065 [Puia sp.]|nr:hypothetical protein [Puia sp.]
MPDFSRQKSKLFVTEAPTPDKIYLDFVGTGDIQKAVSGGQQLNANTGAGIIFERHTNDDALKGWFQSLEVEMAINIATGS